MTAARLLCADLVGRRCRDDRGAQLVEFAVTLPLMMVFVVGIFDFSGAFTLKQKLTNATRDAARAAAAEPATDLSQPSQPLPTSVNDAFQAVKNYLATNHINDCGITTPVSSPGLKWKSTANGNGCVAPGLTLIINRGYYFPQSGTGALPSVNCVPQAPGGQTAVIGTCVSIRYPYPWRFGRVASLLGSAVALPFQISATAVAMNEN
jgi:Flp pilus assembly protein TadG